MIIPGPLPLGSRSDRLPYEWLVHFSDVPPENTKEYAISLSSVLKLVKNMKFM